MKKALAVLLIAFLLNSVFAIIIKAPAVSLTEKGYEGVSINIQINVTKGDGHVFMDTLPLTDLDMQGSARIAAKVAGEVTGKNINKYNTYIIVRSDVPVVGGPSAGGTMTIGIICELMNWSLNKSVMMTGTINPDGSIGPVGGILEKIEAAKKANCTIMLIPKGQRYVEINGNKVDAVEFGKKLGVEVIEVGSIYEAIPYFTNRNIVIKEYPENSAVEGEYRNIMKELCINVLKSANAKYENISKELDNYYLGYEYQKALLNELTASKSLLEDANNEYLDGKYYSATCSAFNALIKLETIEHLLKYMAGEEDVKTYLLYVQSKITQDKNIVYSKNLTTDNFEEVLAGRLRIAEAEELLDEAWKSYYLGNYEEAIKSGSFAKLRGDSAVWWVSLSKKDDNKIINESNLKSLAQQYLDNAETISTYVETLYPTLPVEELDKDLKSAKKAYEQGDYILAIAKSIDASVKAEIPLVIFGDIDYLKKYSKNKINLAENLNIVPISALSYYEYADSFNDSISKIMYYKYASYYAQMDIDVIKGLNKNNKMAVSEINIKNEVPNNDKKITTKNNIEPIISLVIGCLIGFVSGYFIRQRISS